MSQWDLSSQAIPSLQFQVEGNYSGGALPVSGRVEGWIHLQGPWRRLVSQGELFSRNGTFRQERFDLATLRFLGSGPVLKVQDSGVIFSEGALRMEGAVDLRRIGQPDFFRQIRLSSTDKSMAFSGWRVRPVSTRGPAGPSGGAGASGLSMQRVTPGEKVSVRLAYEVDEEVRPEPQTRQKVEVGYSLSDQERLKIRLDRNENFLGVEHRKKF